MSAWKRNELIYDEMLASFRSTGFVNMRPLMLYKAAPYCNSMADPRLDLACLGIRSEVDRSRLRKTSYLNLCPRFGLGLLEG